MRVLFDDATTLRIGMGTAFTANYSGTNNSSLLHLNDWGNTFSDFAQFSLSTANKTIGDRMGVINFACSGSITGISNQNRRTVSVESYLTNLTGTPQQLSGDLRFFTNNSNSFAERMRITEAGNMGIGTTAPAQRLHVVNNADNAGVAAIDNATAGGFAGIYFYQSGSSNYRGHVGYVNTGGTSSFGGKGAFQIASGNRPIIFSATNGAETYNEVARFDNTNSSFILNTANTSYDIIGDNSADEPTWRPSAPDWGYLGTSSNYWYRVYANDYYYTGTSAGSWTSFDTYDDLKLLNDIKMDYYWDDKLNNHVAVINPKTIPKCILSDDKKEDEVFIDVKKLDGLFIGSFRQLDFETKLRDKKIIGKLNEIIASDEHKILSDFGSASGNTSDIIVYFSDVFNKNYNGNDYNVQITPTSPYKFYYLKEKHKSYFVVSVETSNIFTFDWMVSTKIDNYQKKFLEEDLFAPTGWGKVEGDYPNINTLPKKKL